MSTPRMTFEGLDIFTWAAARWLGIDPETARRTSANPYDYDGNYDLREDECPDCGFDIPSGLCDCRPGVISRWPLFHNDARMEDDVWDDEEAEAGHPMRDGGSTYLDDGA